MTDRLEHWAGAATLRMRASETVPGFASIVVSGETQATALWTGRFVSGGELKSTPRSVELLLPGERVVRASAASETGGIFTLTGEAPWPEWTLHSAAGFEQSSRPGFLEVRCARVVTRESWLRAEDLPLEAGLRMLLDYRPLEEILVPLEWFFESAELLASLNAKVAAVIGGPVGLGLLRESARRPAETRPANLRAFRDYDEARLWLLED